MAPSLVPSSLLVYIWSAPTYRNDLIFTQLPLIFTDVVCLFADNIGGFPDVYALLSTWAQIGSASSLRQSGLIILLSLMAKPGVLLRV
jgi:hypothetical protein